MKQLRILSIVLVALIFVSCSSDNESNLETNNESKKTESAVSAENFRLKIKKTEKELNTLLKSEGYADVYDNKLIIGSFENGELKAASNVIEKILELHFKKITQEIGYDVDFSSFEYVNAKDNNGYSMLVSRGICKITGESVSVGVNITVQQKGGNKLTKEGSTVTCAGCTNGCSPRRKENGDGFCTDCIPLSNNCTKTEAI